jgi:carbonic anhydrase/acetyltransferase-like protein (isoleucine patch superfamily)
MPVFTLGERKPEFRGKEYFIAYDATLIGSVILEDRANIWFKVVVRADNEIITIGEGVNVQDASVLHADPGFPLMIEKNVSVGHKAMLHGCNIGEGSLIGMGSIIMNGSVIGRHSIVGSGALVPESKKFPDGVLILGAPARVVREVKPEEIEWIRGIAERYVERSRRYRAEMKPLEEAG